MKKKLQYIIVCICLLSYGVIKSQCFSSVSSGFAHVIGKKTDETYWAWGYNSGGYFGDGTGMDSYVPIQLADTTNWLTYKSGVFNSFVIKNNGTLWGTGLNVYGQLGVGSSGNQFLSFVQAGTATNWKTVFPADSYTIAIKLDGTLWGCGQNIYNQLGQGASGANITGFVQIGSANNWKTVVSSRCASSVAIKTDGTLWGWGSNSCYVFGESDVTAYTVPQQLTLSNDADWDKIAAGAYHFLALKTNGTLWAWGNDSAGQTGHDPSVIQGYELNQIPGNWKAIGAGFRFSMGIKTDGTLWQWGNNDITDTSNTPTNYSFVPFQIGTATNWENISCGNYFTTALRNDGSLWTWGNNDYGQLGDGTTTSKAIPSQVPIDGCSLGTEEFTTVARFTISPIPAQQEIQITYRGAQNVDDIIIYDISGKVVFAIPAIGTNDFSSSFNISQLAAGSYILTLKKGTTTVVASKQFVKE